MNDKTANTTTALHTAVVGTNSWGGKLYGQVLRGSSVDEQELKNTVETAMKNGLYIFDTAQDYGLGEGQKLIGRLCPADAVISAKYTPGTGYEQGQVRRSVMKDLADFGRDHIDIYWLHLPNCITENLTEMAELYKEGLIKNIGVSNFTLNECRKAQKLLEKHGIPLFGVQNHYSLVAREWEKNGLVKWCQDNGIQFWAWAVLEEGILVPPKKGDKMGIMRLIFMAKRRKLAPLYKAMNRVAERHGISAAQTAMTFCSSKGIIPICGCRRPYQAKQLSDAVNITLTKKEISYLEKAADSTRVKVLGADMFRFAVKKEK
ncbi:MAG: aldo/keto reductase [Oscillospiraceae bacterium]|nr:aldo/keto reductase [Oscillospiraceae bacterium]